MDNFIKPLAGALFVLVLTGGVMHFFSPSNNPQPYNKFKEEANAAAAKPEQEKGSVQNSTGATTPKTSDERKVDTDNLIKKITNSEPKPPQPKGNLPRETLEHISKGMALSEQGRFELAEIEFEKAAELSPNSPEVFAIWGASLKMQKKYMGADKRFAQAYKLAPNDEEILFNWGMVKLEDKKSDEAIDLFQKTLKANPKHYLSYNYLGKAFGQKKEYAKETEMYHKALELNPDFAQTHFNLGVVLSIRDKMQEAAPHFEKAIELDKQFEQPFVMKMLTAMGRYQKPNPKKQAEEKTRDAQTAKHDEHKADTQKKKDESMPGHNMDSSKPDKDLVTVKGKALINGEPMGKNGVVFLETKTKLRVAGQKLTNITIAQKNLQFAPSQSVVTTGSSITFTNDDVEVHNIYSKSINNQFNLGAMAGGSSKSIKM